jgi:hypothetical protein
MSARIRILTLLLLLAGLLPAAEADFADRIGEPGAAACAAALEAIGQANGLAKELAHLEDGVNPSVLMDRLQKVQKELRGQAQALKGLKAPEGGQAALDEASVLLAESLVGTAQALQGMRLGDVGLARAGLDRVGRAGSTLQALAAGKAPAAGSVGQAGRTVGASLGLSLSLLSSPLATNWSLSGDGAYPVLSNWDLGLGASVGGGSSSSNGQTSSTANSGWYLYTRVHFPSQDKPIAPYVGFKAGLDYSSIGGTNAGATETTLGPQAGILFFTSAHSAVDLNARLDLVSSDGEDWKPQFWITIGGRAMQ